MLYHACRGLDDNWINSKLKDDPYQDFGAGYYLTFNKCQSASRTLKLRENQVCYIARYEYKASTSSNLRIKAFTKCDEDWLNYIVRNRTKPPCTRTDCWPLLAPPDYDIVYGPMLSDGLDFTELINAVNDTSLGKLKVESALNILQSQDKERVQFCFKTKEAFKQLCLCRYHSTDGCEKSAGTSGAVRKTLLSEIYHDMIGTCPPDEFWTTPTGRGITENNPALLYQHPTSNLYNIIREWADEITATTDERAPYEKLFCSTQEINKVRRIMRTANRFLCDEDFKFATIGFISRSARKVADFKRRHP